MSRKRALDPDRLLHDARWAIEHGLGPRDLIPMLEHLVASAEAGSPGALFGMKHLARLIVAEQPWRAAGLARSVVGYGDDELAFAVLGLAQSLLGHYRAAARAYYRAAALAPDCPVVSHNLGHLLDVGLDRPEDALPYLARAHEALAHDPEIAVSYAHALVRVEQHDEAARVLAEALPEHPEEALRLLESWATETTVPKRTALSG
jgi:tetratricopeptide (TPR) repeat protein